MKSRIKDGACTIRRIFIETDTTPIRSLIGAGSLMWVIGLWAPLDTFSLPQYAVMRTIAGEQVWGTLFLVHALGVAWRMLSRPSMFWGLFVTSYGLFLWIVVTGLVTSAAGRYTPTTAMEWLIIAAQFVALCRTGLNRESTTP